MCSWARHNKKFTDEKILPAGIVKERVVLAAEESFKRILRDRERGGSNTDPADTGAQCIPGTRARKTPHIPHLQEGRGTLGAHRTQGKPTPLAAAIPTSTPAAAS